MIFSLDLSGRVQNIPLSPRKCLNPLFEAISNSIHAVQEANRENAGRLDVYIIRETSQGSLDGNPLANQPVTGFIVKDNGIGFNEDNYASFCKSDTRRKAQQGGRGVGRLLWLKAFERAEVESRFKENGRSKCRIFSFRLQEDPTKDMCLLDAGPEPHETIVKLVGYRPEYLKACPRGFGTIANRIIEHFLQYFTVGTCPLIMLHDEYEQADQSLNKLFKDDLLVGEGRSTLTLAGKKFHIRHVRLSSKIENKHQVYFCANDRPVEAIDPSNCIPNLHGTLTDPETGANFVYAGYVSSRYLDDNVLQDRAGFSIPDDDTLMAGENVATWQQIQKRTMDNAAGFLSEYTEPIRRQTHDRIVQFVKQHPQYRHVLKQRPDWVDQIKVNVEDEELDVELHKLSSRLSAELRQRGKELQSQRQQRTITALNEHKAELARFLDDWNEMGISKLSEYVVHRRATLDFLAECLKEQESGEYELEDIIHEAIFPMRSTSDEVPAEQTNLWVIDERLAYHYYLASDQEFRKVEPVQVPPESERKRTDLLVFQQFEHRFGNPTAFSDSDRPFDSITIVEFKRPMRDDYKDEDNPIDQIEKYIETLQDGKITDKDGQLIRLKPGTPIYAFIICTITEKLEKLAKRRGFVPTPDGQGFIKFHNTMQVYEEILDYHKVIKDARRRNGIFFDKLNMPT